MSTARAHSGQDGGLAASRCAGAGYPRPLVMGVLNVTPDSFSDGGLHFGRDAALRGASRLVEAGADILDVGGESTRPGSSGVSLSEELERVIPVVEAIRATFPVTVSVDTGKPEVMRAAVAAGAGMINDVYALRAPGALEAASELAVPVCLMHMQGEPRTMQHAPVYTDVLVEVRGFLLERARCCMTAGIPRERIYLDPGFGFGKTAAHNLALLNGLDTLVASGFPVLVGLSRKSMIGKLTGRAVGERLAGSVALAVVAMLRGASVVRCHDVAETLDAAVIVQSVLNERGPEDA